MDCCTEFEARAGDFRALPGVSSFECLVPWPAAGARQSPGGKGDGALLKLARVSCSVNLTMPSGPTQVELQYVRQSNISSPSSPAGAQQKEDKFCHCERRYVTHESWDSRGGDLACGGEAFCKVCGGLLALYDACDSRRECAGFVRYYNDQFLASVYGLDDLKPRAADMCGYLKRSAPGQAAVDRLRAEDLAAAGGKGLEGLPRRAVRKEDAWPGLFRDPVAAERHGYERYGKNGVRENWQTFVKIVR